MEEENENAVVDLSSTESLEEQKAKKPKKAKKKKKKEESAAILEEKIKEEEAKDDFIFPDIKDESIRKRITATMEIAEEVHPGKWDFSKVTSERGEKRESTNGGNSRFKLAIHFPKVDLTDGQYHHEIKDLYVLLYFDQNMYHNSTLKGYRGTVVVEELDSAYCHSHTNNSANYEPSAFCLGSSETAELMSMLRNNFSKDILRRILVILYSYVPWESLEGGPYRYVRDLNKKSERIPSVSSSQVRRGVKGFLENSKSFPFDIIKFKNYSKFVLKRDSKKFINTLTKLEINNLIKGEDGQVYGKETNTQKLNEKIDSFNRRMEKRSALDDILFKGERITTKCERLEMVKDDNMVSVAHPQLVNRVADEINVKLNEYFLNKTYYEHRKSD